MSGYGFIENDGLSVPITSEKREDSTLKKTDHEVANSKPLWMRTVLSVVLLLIAAALVGRHSFRAANNFEPTQSSEYLSSSLDSHVDVAPMAAEKNSVEVNLPMVGARKHIEKPDRKDSKLSDDEYDTANNFEPTQSSEYLSSSLDSHVDVAPMAAEKNSVEVNLPMVGKRKRIKKPDRKDSKLSDEEFDKVEAANEAIDKISENLHFPSDSSSPTEVMEFFGSVTDVISIIVPQFAIIGVALNIAGLFMPQPQAKPDPMLVYMENRFDILEDKIRELKNSIDDVKSQICKKTFDEVVNKHLNIFGDFIKRINNPHNSAYDRKYARTSLRKACLTPKNRPDRLLDEYNRIFVTGEKYQNCKKTIQKDCNNRVGYFRRQWAIKLQYNMLKAIEYQGICDGMMEKDNSVQLMKAGSECDGMTTAQCNYSKLRESFQKEEDRMYNLSPNKWLEAFDDYDLKDPSKAVATLKKDFFPDFRYAVVKMDVLRNNELDIRRYGSGGKNYGVFRKKNGLMVLFRNKLTHQTSLPMLRPMFKNQKCIGKSMCWIKREYKDWWSSRSKMRCETHGCDGTYWVMLEDTKENNPETYKTYKERGVLVVKTKRQSPDFFGYDRTTTYAIIHKCVGDFICEVFSEWEKQHPKQWEYTFIGVFGPSWTLPSV